ncbi:unknown [Oscillibacter sp. CAG:155]|nr:unknown [Oscillibacter sp. CAG:155]
MLFHHGAAVIQNLLHHIGRIQIATVDGGRLSPDQLQRRDIESLTEGVGRQGDHVGIEAVLIGENARHLTDHVHAGLFHQAEGLEVLVVSFGTDFQSHGDEGRVAGVSGGHLQGLKAMAGPLGTVDGPSPALDRDGAGAVEGGVHVHHPLLQGRGQGDGLEGGAGLIGGVDAFVAPLRAQNGALGRGDSRLVVLLRFIIAPVLGQLRQLAVQLGLKLFIIQRSVGIGIIGGVGRHGQDGTAVDIHDNAGTALGGVKLGDHAGKAFFQRRLDPPVQRQHQAAAVFRVIVLLILIEHIVAVVVPGGDGEARGPLEDAVILGLQAHAADIVVVDEAQHVGRQGTVGIIPLGIRLQVHTVDPHGALVRVGDQHSVPIIVDGGQLIALVVDLAVDELADLIGDFLVHPLFDDLIGGIGLFHLFPDALLIHLQDAAEPPGDVFGVPDVGVALFLLLIQILLQALRVHKHVFRRGGHRQRMAVAIIDGAPGGSDNGAAGLLGHSLFL